MLIPAIGRVFLFSVLALWGCGSTEVAILQGMLPAAKHRKTKQQFYVDVAHLAVLPLTEYLPFS
ncbi:hypothetical protein D0469_13410 [Peribacillus saganii]|uniref:Uncharacterized protein n=1 Tax=Peribacillus saganii TaxID=2303992 RepID=A0A372LLQ5_9BACI|nr:hypothetical protein D0469_13410 [Peribacillus saganii]